MHKLTALLKHHAFAGLVCLGIVLVLPGIAAGLFADDFFHFVLMQSQGAKPVFAFGLFNFLDNVPGKRLHLQGLSILPWWASPDLTINFFRPLSELTHVIDYRFIYPHVWLMHIHSIAWYTLLLVLLCRFYRNFSPSRPAAIMALLFFAVDASHGLTVSWLANRNAIIAAVFSLLAINTHHAFRCNGLWRYYLLSIMAIALCFSSSEGGIVVGVMLLAYALFMDKDGIFKGLLYLLPALLVFLCWLAIYKTNGFGASGHTYYYIDPLQDSALFLQYLPERFLQAISIQFNILPLNFYPEFNSVAVICGATFLLVLLALMFGKNRPQKTSYRFYCFSLLLAIIPICATEIQDRNLTYVGMLGAPLLADLFLFFSHIKQRWLKYSGIGILVFFHIVLSGLMLAGISYFPKVLTKDLTSTADSLPVRSPYIISLGTPFSHATFVTSIRTTHGLTNPQRFWNLTTSLAGITIQRTGTHTFELEGKNGLFSSYDLKLRNLAVNPIQTGDRFDLDGLSLVIKGLNAEGLPDKATILVDKGISADNLSLVYWTEARRNIQYKSFTLAIGDEKTF